MGGGIFRPLPSGKDGTCSLNVTIGGRKRGVGCGVVQEHMDKTWRYIHRIIQQQENTIHGDNNIEL